MGLSVFPLLQSNTRLVRYQDTLYKLKVTYDEESFQRPRNFITESVAHDEIEQTFRAVLYMDEKNQTFKPIHSDSFIIKPVKRPWTFPQKYDNYAFEQNGKVLKVNTFLYELLVSYRDKSLYKNDERHKGSVKRKSDTNDDESDLKRHKSDGNRLTAKQTILTPSTHVVQTRFERTADGKLCRVACPTSDRQEKPGPSSEGQINNSTEDKDNNNTGYDNTTAGDTDNRKDGNKDETEDGNTGRRNSERSRTSSNGGMRQAKTSERKQKAQERIQHVRMEQTVTSRQRNEESAVTGTQDQSRSRRFQIEDVYDLLNEMSRERRKARGRADSGSDSESSEDYSTKHRVKRKRHKRYRHHGHVSKKNQKIRQLKERSRQKARLGKHGRQKDHSESEEVKLSEDDYDRKGKKRHDKMSDSESDVQAQRPSEKVNVNQKTQVKSRRRSDRLSGSKSRNGDAANESDLNTSNDKNTRSSQRTIKHVESVLPEVSDLQTRRKSKRCLKPVRRYGLDSESENDEESRNLQSALNETHSRSESESEVEDEVLAKIHRKHGVRSQKQNKSSRQEENESEISVVLPSQEYSQSVKTRNMLERSPEEHTQRQTSRSQKHVKSRRSGEQQHWSEQSKEVKRKANESTQHGMAQHSPRRSMRLSLVKKPPRASQEGNTQRSKLKMTKAKRSQKIRLYTSRASPQVLSQSSEGVSSPKVSAVRPVKKVTTVHLKGNQSTGAVQSTRLTRHSLDRQQAELSRIQQLADERATEVYRHFMRERRDRHTVEMEEMAETDKLQQLYQPTQPDQASPPPSQPASQSASQPTPSQGDTLSQPSTSGHTPGRPRGSTRIKSPHGSQGSSTRHRTRASVGPHAVSLTQPVTRSSTAGQRPKHKSSGLWGAFMDSLVTPTKKLVFGK